MKKILCLLFCFLLVLPALPLGVLAIDDRTLKLAVASDLHYNLPQEELSGEIDDEIYWYANRRAAMENESGFIIDEFLNQCEKGDCDYVLLSGDLVDNGRTVLKEHTDIAQKLSAFEKRTGKSVFVINGNHDLGKNSEMSIEGFKEVYRDFGYDKALTIDDSTCSYTADLGDKYRLIALDSCDDTKSTEDGMSIKRVNWVLKQADKAKKDGRYPILMMHHNLLNHLPVQRIVSHDFIVRFHYSTATLFADHGIHLVLSGHEHCSDATKYISPLGNEIYDFATTSLTMYPLQYRLFTLGDRQITYQTATVDKIDTLALSNSIKGYSDKQLAKMDEGLNEYALGFLKKGVQYRLEQSLTMEKMGISPSDFYYDLVHTAVGRLTELLNMPLYGENSLCALAEQYSYQIPESRYQSAWDLATDLVAAHYRGEEDYTLNSAEVELLLKVVGLILDDDLSNLNDEVFLKAAEGLLKKADLQGLTRQVKMCANHIFGSVSPCEYFLCAMLSPLLYEFAFDGDGVNDNIGVIQGYVSQETRFEKISERGTTAWEKMVIYCKGIFYYFSKTVPKF